MFDDAGNKAQQIKTLQREILQLMNGPAHSALSVEDRILALMPIAAAIAVRGQCSLGDWEKIARKFFTVSKGDFIGLTIVGNPLEE